MSLNCFIGPTRRHIISSTKALWLIRRFEGILRDFSKPESADKWEIERDRGLMTSHSEDRIFLGSCLNSSEYLRWSTSSYLIPCLHTLSYLIQPHQTLGVQREWGLWVSRECPGMGGVSVFWQLRVSLARRGVDRWRHKSVSGKIIGDTCSAENNMSTKEIKGKQAESFSSWLH